MILYKNLGFSAFLEDQDKINDIVEIIMKRFDLIMISDYGRYYEMPRKHVKDIFFT